MPVEARSHLCWICVIGLLALAAASACHAAAVSTTPGGADVIISPGTDSGQSTIAPTLILSNTPLSTPSPTNTPLPASASIPTLSKTFQPASDSALYFYDFNMSFYGYIPVNLEPNQEIRLSYDAVLFAHFADRLLRLTWDDPEQMWVSNLALETNLKISGGSPPACPSSWYWSADDLHLICDAVDTSQTGSIYHLATGAWEAWPYACDRIAFSPRSGRLSTWCRATGQAGSFAVLEWGGEAWINSDPPASILVQSGPQQPHPEASWGWSADGQRIAYFDADGYLTIASANGTRLRASSGTGDTPETSRVKPEVEKIEWSADGGRVLVLAWAGTNRACPSITVDGNSLCWYVFDAHTGEVIWQLSDSIEELSDPNFTIHFEDASISMDGRYLALTLWNLNGSLEIIDLNTRELFWSAPHPTFPSLMRWGTLPGKSGGK